MLSLTKKLFMCLIIGALASCSQDSVEFVPPVPTEFTSKAFLEMYNGAWCGFSPDGDVVAQKIKDEVGSDLFDFYEIHNGNASTARDAMVYSELAHMDKRFSIGYPSGIVNWSNDVATYRGAWRGAVDNALAKK